LTFMDLLVEGADMWNVRIAAFCLLPNHYHLVVQTPDANLSRFMRHVDGVYTLRFNSSHRCEGPLFHGRYKAVLLEVGTSLLEVIRYVHRYPLSAGLVQRLDRHPWNSHKGYLSRSRKWSWLHKEFVLSMLSRDKESRRAAYKAFMSKAESNEIKAFYSRKNTPSLMGTKAFVDRVRGRLRDRGGHKGIPESKAPSSGLEAIKSLVNTNYGTAPEDLLSSRRGSFNEPRNVAIYLSRRVAGETLVAIGESFGFDKYSSVSSVLCRMRRALRADRGLRRRVEKIEKQFNKSQDQT